MAEATTLEALPLRVRAVVMAVAHFNDVPVDDLLGTARHRKFTAPRQWLYWQLRQMRWGAGEEVHPSYPQIGEWIGGRDHTAILYGVKKHEARRTAETRLLDLDGAVKQRIYSNERQLYAEAIKREAA